MVNENLYTGKGPAHWGRFYSTLDKFPKSGPIPAPPEQAAVETSLIRNVSVAVGGGPDAVGSALSNFDRELTEILAGRTTGGAQ